MPGRSYDAEEYILRHEMGFRDPGGRSALRRGKRCFPCPTCGAKNVLSRADVRRGYQCDRCADRAEGLILP